MNQDQATRWVKKTGGSGGERWEPQKGPYNPANQAGNTLQGYLIDEQERIGPRGSFKVFVIQTVKPDGSLDKIFDISGGIVLQNTLEKIALNSYIAVVYKGKAVSKKGGSEYHLWDVFEDPGAIPFDQLNSGQKQAAPFGASAATPPAPQASAPTPSAPAGNNPPPPQQNWVPPVQATGPSNPANLPPPPTFTAPDTNKPPY